MMPKFSKRFFLSCNLFCYTIYMFIIIHAITVHYNLRATTPKYKYYAYYAFMHFIISYTYLRLCTKIIIIIIRCAY